MRIVGESRPVVLVLLVASGRRSARRHGVSAQARDAFAHLGAIDVDRLARAASGIGVVGTSFDDAGVHLTHKREVLEVCRDVVRRVAAA